MDMASSIACAELKDVLNQGNYGIEFVYKNVCGEKIPALSVDGDVVVYYDYVNKGLSWYTDNKKLISMVEKQYGRAYMDYCNMKNNDDQKKIKFLENFM